MFKVKYEFLPFLIISLLFTIVVNKSETVASLVKNELVRGFPGGAVVENLPANARDMGSSPGLGRSHMPRRA